MDTTPHSGGLALRLRRFAGGFAVGLGLGTLALAVATVNHPAIPLDFSGATALIGLFCMALGRTCLTVRAELDAMDLADAQAA